MCRERGYSLSASRMEALSIFGSWTRTHTLGHTHAHHTYHKHTMAAHKTCDGPCADGTAAVWCTDCTHPGLALCLTCDTQHHRGSHRADHARWPICMECSMDRGHHTCAECPGAPFTYCNACWDFVHGGPLASHARQPVERLVAPVVTQPQPDASARTGATREAGVTSSKSVIKSDKLNAQSSDEEEEDDEEEDEEEEEEEEEDTEEGAEENDAAPPKKKTKRDTPTLKATAKLDPVTGAAASTSTSAPSKDGGPTAEQLKRIRDMVRLALDERTPEAEATHALRLAKKWQNKYNLLDTDVAPLDGSEQAAEVEVVVEHTHGLTVARAPWMSPLIWALTKFYACKCYFPAAMSKRVLLLRFYGRRSAASYAADGYAALFNCIMDMAARNTEICGMRAKSSYREGLARGLLDRVDNELNTRDAAADNECRDIIMHDKAALAVAEAHELTLKLKPLRQRSKARIDVDAYYAGKRDSSKLQIGQKRLK